MYNLLVVVDTVVVVGTVAVVVCTDGSVLDRASWSIIASMTVDANNAKLSTANALTTHLF